MASKLGAEFVDRVRSAVDLVGLVSETVALKRAGHKHRGLCPFHPEKTPSFYVDEAKGLFYCFGCQAGGDAFRFVMLRDKVEFPGALRQLADLAGIPIPEARTARPSQREGHLEAHRAAADFYHELLTRSSEGEAARGYLERRGVTTETIESLQIGFAPDRWDALKTHLAAKGFSTELLAAGGLLSLKEETRHTYDRFRARVVFPIRNLGGEVVGFGGRALGAEEPKYLNSAESPLYNKREHLFGLDLARPAILAADEAVVVEGYFDFAGLWQAGVRHTVATLGTAFSEGQAALLRRFTRRVVISYDPDAAGAAATRRSIEMLVGQGLKVRVLQLEPGLDPDEFVRRRGPGAYLGLLAAAPRYFEYLLRRATEGKDLSDFEVKSAALQEIVPALAVVPDRIERSGYVTALAERLAIGDEVTLAEVRDALMKGRRPPAPRASAGGGATSGIGAAPIAGSEGRLLRAMLEDAVLLEEMLPQLTDEDLAGSALEGVVRAVAGLRLAGEPVSYARLTEVLEEPGRSHLARLAMTADPVVSREEALRCMDSIRLRRLRRERESLQKEMEREADRARLQELMRRKMELSRQIDTLS